MTVLAMILAHDKNGGIGKDNKIPWKCKSDIDFFWNTIGDHTVIVGRKTHLHNSSHCHTPYYHHK